LEVQHRGEGPEDYALPGVLQTVALGLVFVLPIEGLDLDVVLERIVEVLHALHIQLKVCSGGVRSERPMR
jgi:hypothetical protein